MLLQRTVGEGQRRHPGRMMPGVSRVRSREKSVPEGSCQCKGPEVGTRLACWRDRKGVSVAEVEPCDPNIVQFSHPVVSDSLRSHGLHLARQAPLSMGFPRHEYGSGLPFPPPGDLPNPGTEPTSPVLADEFFTTEPPGTPMLIRVHSERQGPLWVRPALTLAGIAGGRCSPWVPQRARHHAKGTPPASKSVLQARTHLPPRVT